MIRRELQGLTFACIPECGYCCTNPPQVSPVEFSALRAKVAPLPVTFDGESTSLGLQGGCGACVLLKDRACTEYGLRPDHCRYFPFHVHFGPEPEILVNYTCRGVVPSADGDLSGAFASSVLARASAEVFERHHEEAVATFNEFSRRAREAGAWRDPAPVLAKARRQAASLLTARGIEALCARSGEPARADDVLEEALEVFEGDDIGRRPYYLAPDLRWLTFVRQGSSLDVVHVHETGKTETIGEIPTPPGFPEAGAATRAFLAGYLERVLDRHLLRGQVYHRVDAADYEADVEEALAARIATVAADVMLRAYAVAKLDSSLTGERVADEAARFYDTEFLDAASIGGFL